MLARVLMTLLAIAGPNPLRICTCHDHDEPLLGAAGDDHPEGCHCPVFQPVAKHTVAASAAPDASQFAFLLPPSESTGAAANPASSQHFERSSPPPAVPLYVTLRTLRN